MLGSSVGIPEMSFSRRVALHGFVVCMQMRVVEDLQRCWVERLLDLEKGLAQLRAGGNSRTFCLIASSIGV
jgi:hypothetical protein